MAKVSKFQRNYTGKSTYICKCCGHNTRISSEGGQDAAGVGCCEFCYEVAGQENLLQDGYINEVEFEAFVLEMVELYKVSPDRARRGSGLTLDVLGEEVL